MVFTYIAAAFVVGMACMAYLRDRDDRRRVQEEWERKYEAESFLGTRGDREQ